MEKVKRLRGKQDVYPDTSECLQFSVCTHQFFGPKEQKVLERFIITMYNRSSSATDVNSVWLDMFPRTQKSYGVIPQPVPFWFNI